MLSLNQKKVHFTLCAAPRRYCTDRSQDESCYMMSFDNVQTLEQYVFINFYNNLLAVLMINYKHCIDDHHYCVYFTHNFTLLFCESDFFQIYYFNQGLMKQLFFYYVSDTH